MVMSKITSCLGCKNEFTEHCKPCDKFSNYDNNPSPQDNAKRSVTLLAKGTGTIEDVEILNDFITNYANMVESLEGFKNDYQKLLEWVKSQLERIDKTAQDEVKYEVRKELYNSFIADITKVLEGKK